MQLPEQGSLQVGLEELAVPAIAAPTNQAGQRDRARKWHVTIRCAKVNSNRIHFDQDDRLVPTAA